MTSVRPHHVSFTVAGVLLLLVAHIPPFDWASALCLAGGALNLVIGLCVCGDD